MNLAIGLVVGVMACAVAGTFGAAWAQEESQWDGVSSNGAVSAQEKSQWDGVYSADQATRGIPLYQEHCASCHGPDMRGGEMAPDLVGGDFTTNWNDVTLGELFDRIRITMPQNSPGSLSRQQTADILASMLARGAAPAGAADLSTESDVLRTIKYLAVNPKEAE